MKTNNTHRLITFLHVLCWVAVGIALLVAIVFIGLACGINGRHFQKYFDAAVPETVGRLTVNHIAFWPGRGIIVKGINLQAPNGKTLVGCSRAIADFRILSPLPLQDRLTALQLDDLFVAQIEHDPNKPESTRHDPHDPLPDFNGIRLPQFDQVALTLNRPDVLEVRLNEIHGRLTTRGGSFLLQDLKGDVDGEKQHVDASLDINLYAGTVKANIRGYIFQTTINGVYRALDFPIIEKYSNNFTLAEPAWADCSFEVGFDKYRNIFSLRVDIVAKNGAYCGVAFDEAQGTIRCNGIWDAVTTINPIIAHRNGKVIASGKLRFDCPNDKFFFEANGSGITPTEALQLIDMPFTEAIPKMTSEEPPSLYFRGNIPLLTEQSPDKVVLNGVVSSPTPFTFDRIMLGSANALLSMQQGVFSIDSLSATLPHGGSVNGRVDISIPNDATYTDIAANVELKQTSLADLLQPFHMDTLTNCVATGTAALSCRTDETFKSSINSTFDLAINGGLIGRIPLFAGFTNLMADNVPGISTLTDTSDIHLKGTAEKGLVTIPHFTLSGSLFMIEGPVTYSIPKDHLYAKVIAGVFKKNTLVGTLTRWATVPFTKLLWQVEVYGPIGNPKWNNLTIVEKVFDFIPFTGTKEDKTQ